MRRVKTEQERVEGEQFENLVERLSAACSAGAILAGFAFGALAIGDMLVHIICTLF